MATPRITDGWSSDAAAVDALVFLSVSLGRAGRAGSTTVNACEAAHGHTLTRTTRCTEATSLPQREFENACLFRPVCCTYMIVHDSLVRSIKAKRRRSCFLQACERVMCSYLRARELPTSCRMTPRRARGHSPAAPRPSRRVRWHGCGGRWEGIGVKSEEDEYDR
jgi:hypothetical protein